MFSKKTCEDLTAHWPNTVSAATQADEHRAVQHFQCPSKQRMKYSTSRPPTGAPLADAALAGSEVWLHNHVFECLKCGKSTEVTFSRPGTEPPPSGVAVRSKARRERYIFQHFILPQSVFRDPLSTIAHFVEKPTEFGNSLFGIACQSVNTRAQGAKPIAQTRAFKRPSLAAAVAIQFEDPRGIGECYFALIALREPNTSPRYFVAERTLVFLGKSGERSS